MAGTLRACATSNPPQMTAETKPRTIEGGEEGRPTGAQIGRSASIHTACTVLVTPARSLATNHRTRSALRRRLVPDHRCARHHQAPSGLGNGVCRPLSSAWNARCWRCCWKSARQYGPIGKALLIHGSLRRCYRILPTYLHIPSRPGVTHSWMLPWIGPVRRNESELSRCGGGRMRRRRLVRRPSCEQRCARRGCAPRRRARPSREIFVGSARGWLPPSEAWQGYRPRLPTPRASKTGHSKRNQAVACGLRRLLRLLARVMASCSTRVGLPIA
mmetsp:Transcript_8985/g.27469  ORF Transcript_8985/g.27469 Transcript_8985/m.27469 type:complete len:273 (+) Transcript_8985:641-1459(+)